MKSKPVSQDQDLLFKSRLSEQLNPQHELLRLARAIDWNELEAEFSPLFSSGPGYPPIPIRLACGLMILQHMFDVSDERVVEAWVENPYWQAFCGYDFLQWELPMHCKKIKKAQKPLRRLRRYLGKLLKELDPHLESCPKLLREMAIGAKLLLQNRKDKNKIYSCHEPQVSCIAKGKAHKPYEFGSKACLVVTAQKGLALSMTTHVGNPYDGHLLAESKYKAENNAKTTITRMLVDRGFKGHGVTDAEVLISYTRGLPKGLKIALRRRQAIEPWIGHMKHDGKLGRCYLKGVVGDQIHATLVAVAHNFRIILRKLRFFYVEIWVRIRGLLSFESAEKRLLQQAT